MNIFKKIGAAFKKLLSKTLFDKTFWRFVLVGVVNTLIGLGVNYLVLWLLGLNERVSENAAYWIASAANYTVGSIVSFFLNKYFTFQVKERSIRFVVRFIINITICYLLAYGIAKPLVARILSSMPANIQENGAMLVGMCLFVALNYIGQRFFAFRQD